MMRLPFVSATAGLFTTRAEAMRTAHRLAARLATLKALWPGDR
jgi:hypothetical protein